jgi:hypothetical protein
MKKNIIILLILFAFMQTIAQDVSLIRHNPQNTNGFIVLENNFQADVSYWSLIILQNTYEDFELVNQEELECFELMGKNFMKIPEEYMIMENLSMRIIAHFPNQNEIEEDIEITPQAPGGPQWERYKEFPCIGSTYAYNIVQYKHVTIDKSYLTLTTAVEQTNPVVYYYQYWPLSLINSINPSAYVNNAFTPTNLYRFYEYYNIPPTQNLNNLITGGGIDVIIRNNPATNRFKTANGNTIYESQVFGVKKDKGPWAKNGLSGNCLTTTEIHTIQIADVMEAIDYMNNYGSPVPCGMFPLSCDNPNRPSTSIGGSLNEEVGEELEIELDTIVWYWDIFENVQSIANLEIGEFWSPYSGISIHQISDNGNLISDIQITDLFDNEGNKIDIPLQLNPGLYNITITFDDGSFIRIVEEKENEAYNPDVMANHLSATFFPVPIMENDFNINLSATESMEMEYTLHNFNGDIIYQTTIVIEEGTVETINISPDSGIPNGYLVNVFHFSDDSQLSIITVKSE